MKCALELHHEDVLKCGGTNQRMRDYGLLPRCEYLRFLGTLRSVDWYYLTDVSRQPICSIFTGKADKLCCRETSVTTSRRPLTSQNIEDFNAFLTLAFGSDRLNYLSDHFNPGEGVPLYPLARRLSRPQSRRQGLWRIGECFAPAGNLTVVTQSSSYPSHFND